MDALTLTAAIIAITQAIKTSIPGVTGLITMVVAIVIGALAGYFKVEPGIDIYHGILLGIAAVGTHTAFSAMGTQSSE